MVGSSKTVHRIPRICSFNIVITQVSCGDQHTLLITKSGGFVYTMGSTAHGKLGAGDPNLTFSDIPCLVEDLQEIDKVCCGSEHSVARAKDGRVFAWGQSAFGALGVID